MKTSFLLRLLLDGVAAGLMLLALAYYWLGNAVHEWLGTAMLGLVLAHNVFNRRWWAHIGSSARSGRGWFDRAWTLLLLAGMAALLLTSVLISQNVFAFLQAGGGFTARQLHQLAAYWVVVLVAVHLGVRWARVMLAVRGALRLSQASPLRVLVLRGAAAVVAGGGLLSAFDMGLGGKLAMQMSLDGWDFEAQAAGFFLRWASIVGLGVALTHYTLVGVHAFQRRAARRTHPSTQGLPR